MNSGGGAGFHRASTILLAARTTGPIHGLARFTLNIESARRPTSTRRPAWDEIARLYRTVCLLRARGRVHEAAQLETGELTDALEIARRSETDADLDVRLSTLFATEEERVATAVAIAEVLTPLLAERLQLRETASERDPVRPPLATRPNGTMPNIADFIDQMLERESRAAPSSRAG